MSNLSSNSVSVGLSVRNTNVTAGADETVNISINCTQLAQPGSGEVTVSPGSDASMTSGEENLVEVNISGSALTAFEGEVVE